MTTPELGDPFMDAPIDVLQAMPAFAAEYSHVPPDRLLRITNVLFRNGQITTKKGGERTGQALTTRRELLLVTDFWIDNPDEMPRDVGPLTMTFVRAFCGYQPAIANMERMERNKEQERAELAEAPLSSVLLDTVVIDNTEQTFVTGKAIQRFVSKKMPHEKNVRLNSIIEHIGHSLTPNVDQVEGQPEHAPRITAPGVAFLRPAKSWDRASDWGISPQVFPLSYELLGAPGESEVWGHTPRCDRVVQAYLQALQGATQ